MEKSNYTAKLKRITALLLFVGFIEGFTSLGIETYSFRIASHYVGSTVGITGVILAVVLVCVALGYYGGGLLCENIAIKHKGHFAHQHQALIKSVSRLLLGAIFIYSLAFIVQDDILLYLTEIQVNGYLIAICIGLLNGIGIALGCAIVPLLSQAVFNLKMQIGHKNSSGKMLGLFIAITTLGNVVGSVGVPVWSVPHLGLVLTNFLMIAGLVGVWLLLTATKNLSGVKDKYLSVGKVFIQCGFAFLFLSALSTVAKIKQSALPFFSTATADWLIYQEDDKEKGEKYQYLVANQSELMSCWSVVNHQSCFPYIQAILDNLDNIKPQNAVFFGGAGMTAPFEYANKNSDKSVSVIELDGQIESFVFQRLLKADKPQNFSFINQDAISYLIQNAKLPQRDFLVIDVFKNKFVPSDVYSVESLSQIKQQFKNVIANVIVGYNKEHSDIYRFTQVLLNNWLYTFGENAYLVADVNQEINKNAKGDIPLTNALLCNYPCQNGIKISESAVFDKNNGLGISTLNKPILDKYIY